MTTWRCPTCFTSWPVHKEFDYCPECGAYTLEDRGGDPDFALEEALAEKKRLKFEKFYEKWDRTKPAKRLEPTPQDVVRFPFRPKQADAAQ